MVAFVVRFPCKNKLLVLFKAIFPKNLCKNVRFRGHIFVFLQIILQLSLSFIAHLKYKQNVNHKKLTIFSLCNYVILRGRILNISKTVFPKLIFHRSLENQLPDVPFLQFYIHSTYVINHCF